MSDYNPYQASSVPGITAAGSNQGGGISPTVISHLSRTKPWVQFLGVLGMILSGLILLVGLFVMLGGDAANRAMLGRAQGESAAPMMMGLGVFYLLLGALYFYISVKLFGYGSAIGNLRYSGQIEHLELALDRQRSVWKSIGIIMLIMIVLWVIGVIAMVTFATRMASNASESFPPSISAPADP
jgi:hypothetical protein